MGVVEIDGCSIAYEVRGEGKPLVFLHCWTGNRAFFFEQVASFSRDYMCVCLDFPGHGESGEASEYSVESFARITLELLDMLEIKSAVFAGHSLGGMVCLYLALEQPERVEGLILLDTTSYLSGYNVQRIIALGAVALGNLGFKPAKAAVAGLTATHPLATPRVRMITARECCKTRNRPLVKTLNSVRKFNVTDRLGEVEEPALIVVGTGDVLADVRHARTMARGLPNSTLKVVRGAGHMALFEKPKVVNKAIADFLDRAYPPHQVSEKAR